MWEDFLTLLSIEENKLYRTSIFILKHGIAF